MLKTVPVILLAPGRLVSAEAPAGDSDSVPALLLTGIIVLAALLRFWRLGAWGFEGDEIFTLRDSLDADVRQSPAPDLFPQLLPDTAAAGPSTSLGLRILPALFGVLGIPALYLVGRRLVGTRAALFAALLLTVSRSTSTTPSSRAIGRSYSCSRRVYPFAIYLGIRERNGRALALGLVTAALAVLAHPVSLLLVGGLAVWLLT